MKTEDPIPEPQIIPASQFESRKIKTLPLEEKIKSWKPTVLVLGPGGAKGFLELGALLVLEKHFIYEHIKTYVGVSVGAIISFLLVCGYTVGQITNIANEFNIFQDVPKISFRDIQNNAGIISNEIVRKKLTDLAIAKFGHSPSLQQLFMYTGLTLNVVTANLTHRKVEYINYNTKPNIEAVQAILLSMNIPFVFYRLEWENCVYIDGAMGNPYPVDIYDDGETDILGIYIETDSANASYFYQVVDFSMNIMLNKIVQNSSRRCKHVRLTTSHTDTFGVSFTEKVKTELVMDGINIMTKFLDKLYGKKKKKKVLGFGGRTAVRKKKIPPKNISFEIQTPLEPQESTEPKELEKISPTRDISPPKKNQ